MRYAVGSATTRPIGVFLLERDFMEVTKRCIRCGKEKPITEFYKSRGGSAKPSSICKECTRLRVKERRDLHPEKELETRLKACKKNPSHKNAYMAVDAAIRCGKLVKPNCCQGCGRSAEETRLSSHHYDYTKPLDVIWLCAACHRKVDHVRTYVESGKSWDNYKREKQKALNHVKRALDFYEIGVKHRKPFDKSWIMKTLGW